MRLGWVRNARCDLVGEARFLLVERITADEFILHDWVDWQLHKQ